MYKEYLNRLKSENISEHRHKEKLTSLINRKTIRYHLDKLVRDYNILPEERTPWFIAKHVLKTLFWATVYLAFSYLTITSSFEVIEQYHDDQTTTIMKAVINNNVTYLPNMTICFKINVKNLFNIHSTSSLNYTSAWYRFFEETVSPEGIFKVNKRQVYDDEIYLSLFKYLAMIYEAERALEPGLTQISTFRSEESDDWIALKKVLVPNIERYIITLEQLKSVFVGKLCSLPASDYLYNGLLNLAFERPSEAKCVAGSKISFIGMDTICIRLIGYQNYLRQLGVTNRIFMYPYDDYKSQTWCQEFTIDLGSESRSTPRRATTRNVTYGYFTIAFSDPVFINMDIGVKTLYQKLPYVNGVIQCSSDTSQEECENKCLRGWIRANCHCSPITFNLTADTSSYRKCTVEDYTVCLERYMENATSLCTSKCVSLCEQWHYEYDLLVHYESYNSLDIRLRTFDYVIIEQVFLWNSFEEFIGALGGALGIWLGLDFVIIIEFIVNVITSIIKKIMLRNFHNSQEEEKHEDSANIKHREKTAENGISLSNEIGSRVVVHQKKYKENESQIDGRSIRQINETEKQRAPRKRRQSDAVREKHEQQRRKRSNNNKADSAILDEKMKNNSMNNERLQNHKVNIHDIVDTVQNESTAHANYSSAQSWFIQKILLLFLNGDVSTNKRAMFLQLVEKLFWTAIYLVGSVFTILWCVELVNLYLADETIYYPSLIINRTVSLPPSSLCFNYRIVKQSFKRHGKTSNALMDYFSQPDIDRVSFIKISNGKPWPEQLVSIEILYIRTLIISETDYLYVNFTERYEKQLDKSSGGENLLRSDIDKSVKDILLPKLLEWKVAINELLQKLGAELARMIELKINFTNSTGTTDIVNETSFYTVAITDELFCYSLSYAVNFTDPDYELEFSINRTSYPQLFSESGGSYIYFSDFLLEPKSAQFSIPFISTHVYGIDYFNIAYGEELKGLITVDGLYTSRPVMKGVEHCSPNMTKWYCRAQCRIKLIEKLCNCSPTYWAMMIQPTSGLDECTFDRYMECLNFNAGDDLDCKETCLTIHDY